MFKILYESNIFKRSGRLFRKKLQLHYKKGGTLHSISEKITETD